MPKPDPQISKREQAADARRRAEARDAALDLIRHTNRWLATGAVATAGAVALWASHTFHAHARPTAAVAAPAATSGTSTSGFAQAPIPVVPVAPVAAPVVSGGS
jgi:hypothetical protein